MKNNIYCLLCITIISSCTSGEDGVGQDFFLNMLNSTGQTFNLKVQSLDDSFTLDIDLINNQSIRFCTSRSERFQGLDCNSTIEIIFDNNTGYKCLGVDNSMARCPSSLFDTSKFVRVDSETNIYQIRITQEDFNNAFDLPE